MAPVPSQEHVDGALRALGHYRVTTAQQVAREGEPDGISGALVLALGLRESGLKNILNPAGTDRGVLQISDRYHAGWLASVPGCPSGSWHPVPGKTALDAQHCPRFTDAVRYAIGLLQAGAEFAADHDVPAGERLRFAIASYNAGAGGALAGYRAGDVDSRTTGKDYSAWVLARRTQVNQSAVFKKWKVA